MENNVDMEHVICKSEGQLSVAHDVLWNMCNTLQVDKPIGEEKINYLFGIAYIIEGVIDELKAVE